MKSNFLSTRRNPGARIGILCTLVVLVIFGVWALSRPILPSFKGKSVYYWMLQTKSTSLDDNPGLLAIGTNAIPYLARAVRMPPTYFDRYAWLRQPRAQKIIKRLPLGFKWTHSAREVIGPALNSLLAFGSESRPALNQLHEALTDPALDRQKRQLVIGVLIEIGPPPESLPHLLRAWPLTTNASPNNARHDLVGAISRISEYDPQRSLQIFLHELNDPDPRYWDGGAWGVNKLGPLAHAATPALERMLYGTNDYSVFAAAEALGRITNSLPRAIPRLRELTRGSNGLAAAGAALTLWRWGEPAQESVAVLTKLLTDKNTKGAAANYLRLIGPAAKPAIPALLEASQQDIGAWVDRYDRALCAFAALQLGGPDDIAIHELEEALSFTGNPWVRYAVARDLGARGQLAAPLLPALRRNLTDSYPDARRSAGLAVRQIEEVTKETH